MAAVDMKAVTKRYSDTVAVNAIDLHVAEGTLVCLLGPSGCGKTTILRLIAGFIALDDGEIRVGGKLMSSPGQMLRPELRGMSMVFQSYALWPHMNVAQNVGYGLKLRNVPKSDLARRVDAILAATKLSALADRYPAELSGGQQQRVALARALVVEPEILLLDEPLSNLDANLREEMRFEIRRLHDEFRYTTIYVTHDQTEAMTAADIIVVMNAGRVEQAASPADIYERPASRFVASFIGGANLLEGRGIAAESVEIADWRLRCGLGRARTGEAAAVSIRFHDVKLSRNRPDVDANLAEATVIRQIYLGSYRDYLVALPGGQQLRSMAPVDFSADPGETVWVRLPPESCRALAD
ncbi:MAG: iron(III) transport system ATP-binding protein [Methylobacteriaceae bacterium]|nr:iron(III) transport system ATP-binding protein [Methylobacteriaceae bacterium]